MIKQVFPLQVRVGCFVVLSLSASGVNAATYPLSPDPNPNGNYILIAPGDTAINGAGNGYFNFGVITVQPGGRVDNQLNRIFVNEGAIVLNPALSGLGGWFVNQGSMLNNSYFDVGSGLLDNLGSFTDASAYPLTTSVGYGGLIRNLDLGVGLRGSFQGLASSSMSIGPLGNVSNSGDWSVAGGLIIEPGVQCCGGGVLQNFATGIFTLTGYLMNNSAMYNEGTFKVLGTGGSFLHSTGLVSNTGDFQIDSTGYVRLETAEGHLVNDNSGGLTAGTISVAPGSTLNSVGGTIEVISGSLTNDGTIQVESGAISTIHQFAVLSGTGRFEQRGPLSKTIVNGTMGQNTIDIFEGELCGTGSLTSAVTYVGPSASVCPGLSPGTLTIHGDLNLDGAYVTEIDSATLHDQLIVDGQLILGANSVLDLRFGPDAQLGDLVTILQAGSLQGGFGQTLFPDGYDAQVVDAGDGSLTVEVTGVPQVDTDGDGVADGQDNCTLVVNPTQCDSDGDGYGNRCDGDMNNNGSTNAQDTTLYRQQLGQPSNAPTYNKADINCGGSVNAQDTTLYRQLLGRPPGPSGLVP